MGVLSNIGMEDSLTTSPAGFNMSGRVMYLVDSRGRDTGECEGGLGSSAWNDGGAPVLVTPVSGFYCFGDPAYQENAIQLMQEYGLTWTLVSYNGWGGVALDGTIEAEDFEVANRDIARLMERAARHTS